MNAERVILAGFYPPPFAGEPIHVKQLAHFLRGRGLRVDVLNLNRHAPPSPEYHRCEGRSGILRMLLTLPDHASILHLHTNGHSGKSWTILLLAGLAVRFRRARAILTIHSGLFPGHVSAFGPTGRVLARWILRSFRRIICVNNDIESAMGDLGVSRSRLVLIPAFLGVPTPGALGEADRALVGGRHPVVVAVAGGEHNPELGLKLVIEALPRLAKQFPTIRALFIGWQVGPQIGPLIQARGLGELAVCVGEVSHERCLGLLREADVVVRSTYADGDAITIREALSLGVPVVASDAARRPEGVLVFRRGDVQDLVAKLEQALAVSRDEVLRPGGADKPARDLWRVYSELLNLDSTLSPSSRTPRDAEVPVTPP
jgi:glycogen synthase